MKRLLACAEFLFGHESRDRVFEPLVADLLGECASRPSLLLRARWWLAIAGAFVRTAPRAAFGGLSRWFVIDLTGRAIAFGAAALALQWLFGMRFDATVRPPTFLSTLPFILVPVIWRVRLETIAVYQQRLLIAAVTAPCAAGILLSEPEWPLRAAALMALVFLGFMSWRLGDYHVRRHGAQGIPGWTVLHPAWVIILSAWPLKIALGLSVISDWWPGDNLIAYLLGVVIALSVRGRVQRQIAGR